MKTTIGLALALGFATVGLASSATAQTRHQPSQTPATKAQPAGESQAHPLSLKPYTHSGEGNDDGLSRSPDDCNKGCIGGNAD